METRYKLPDVRPVICFRVNGPLSNMPEFAAAFDCGPEDPMVRPDGMRADIW